MNLKDEMEYTVYGYLDNQEKPGKATKYSKEITKIVFNNLLEKKWRQMAQLKIAAITEEELEKLGYVKKDEDEGRIIA